MPCYRIRRRHIKRIPSLDKILDSLEKKGRVITNTKDTKYLGLMFRDFKNKGMIHFGGNGYVMLNPDYKMKHRNKKIIEIIRDKTT